MDKYEYRVKTEQMLEYVDSKSYDKAMEIADTIDWRKVKNVPMLTTVSEIYENMNEHKKALDVLFIAYDKAPSSRKLVYQIGVLSLKMGMFDEAMNCYEEFVKIAPKDPNQYILHYKILQAQKAPIAQQIEALEDFKRAEYVEKWAYELARLYYEAGMKSECLEECDDLILWFSEGKYVYAAMELKMKFKQLTPLQQEKYNNRRRSGDLEQLKKKPLFKKPKEIPEPAPEVAQKIRENVHVTGTIDLPDLPEPLNKYDSPDLDSLPDERPNMPVPRTKIENTSEIVTTISGDSLAEILKTGVAVANGMDIEEINRMNLAQEQSVEVTGQMKIEEILANWEVTQRENAKIIEQNQAEIDRKKASEKKKQEPITDTQSLLADDIRKLMEELENGVPEEPQDDQFDEDEFLEAIEEEDVENKADVIDNLFLEDEYEDDEEDEYEDEEDEYEDEEEDEYEDEEDEYEDEEEDEYEDEEEDEYEDEDDEYEDEEDEYEDEEDDEYEDEEDEYEDEEDEYEEEEDEYEDEEDEYEDEEDEYEEEEDEYEDEEDEYEDEEEDEYENEEDEYEDEEEDEYEEEEDEYEEEEDEYEDEEDDEYEEEVEEQEVLEIEEPEETEIEARLKKFDTGFVVQGRYDLSATSEIGLKAGLTEDQKKLFSYFVPIRGVSEQLVEILDNDRRCKNRYGTSSVGNILIIGRKGTGKTVLAVDIVKAIQKQRNLKQGKVAIVTGESLNKKDLSEVVEKLKGGALIIEKASKMNPKTIHELNEIMEGQTGELLFILEEQKKPMDKLLAANPEFKSKFTSKLELPVFINDELVTFGQTYAKENGYKIDEMGILALYSRIDMMQREDHAVTVAEVKEIMDEAIEHSQKANMKHLMKRVFGRNKDEANRVILKEEDFKI